MSRSAAWPSFDLEWARSGARRLSGPCGRPGLLEPRRELGDRDGPAEVVALCGVAAECAECLPDGFVFDAFGGDGEAEVAAEVDGGAHDGVAVVVFVHLHDEAAVDFDLVDWEVLEVGE